MYSKGSLANTLEEEDHLMYDYLPEYQRQRWFEVKDCRTKDEGKGDGGAEVVKRKGRQVKRPAKNKYVFAYL